jgi:hypothetical protein
MPEDDEIDQYAKRVSNDHYLNWLAVVAVGIWAWQVHSFLAAFASLAAILIGILIGNMIILATTANLKAIKINRWFWVWAVFAVVVATSVTVG